MDEISIIKQCQAGDLEKFGLIYDKYIKPIYNFVYYKTMHKETAEDLVSHIFTKTLENIIKYSPDNGSFSSWLYRIARNTIIDHYRAKKETTNIEDAWNLSSNENIENDIHNKKQLEDIKKYLKNLTPEQREIIIMRVWDELSYKEIAAILNKSEDSCKMMFSRTINKLRKDLPLELLILLLLRL